MKEPATDEVYTLPHRHGWFFVCGSDEKGDLVVVTAKHLPIDHRAAYPFLPVPSGLRGFELERWALSEMELTAKLRLERPELRLVLHARDMHLRRIIAEACQQKVADQGVGGGRRDERSRTRERTAIVAFIGKCETAAINPDVVEVLAYLRTAIENGNHHHFEAREAA